MGVGDGAGEAGRLDGLKNEGVLIACIAQGLEECGVRLYGAVVGLEGVGSGMVVGSFYVYGRGQFGHPQR